MVHHVLYTREQADRVLPLVRAIVDDQRELYARLRKSLSDFHDLADLEDISATTASRTRSATTWPNCAATCSSSSSSA